jgi:hypothetical protein
VVEVQVMRAIATVLVLAACSTRSLVPSDGNKPHDLAAPRPDLVTTQDLSAPLTVDLLVPGDGGQPRDLGLFSRDLATAAMLSFASPAPYSAGTNPTVLTIGDLDGDGKLDIATVSLTGSSFAMLFGVGDGTFGLPITAAFDSLTDIIASADFNSDQMADLVITNDVHATHMQTVDVLLSTGRGTFQTPLTYLACDDRQAQCPNGTAMSFATGDLTGDTRPDVAISQAVVTTGLMGLVENANVATLVDQSGGGFQVHGPAPLGGQLTNAGSIALGDFNHDGNLDVAQSQFGANHQVLVALGNGDGTFGTPSAVDLATDMTGMTIATGDFNHDGKIDLVGAGKRIVVALGNGDGTFQTPKVGTSPTNRISIAVADFDSDGKLDVAVPSGGKSVSVLLGNGDGTFSLVAVPTSGQTPTNVATGDFNSDGRPDIAATDTTGLEVFLNTTH